MRWLASKKRDKEAKEILEKAAKCNGITLRQLPDITETADRPSVNLWTVMKHARLRRWSFNLFFNWAINALVYYALSLSADQIGQGLSIYLTFVLLAIIEIPFVLLISYVMDKLGRRITLAGTLIIVGVLCFISAFTTGKVSIATGVLGKGKIVISISCFNF